MRSKDERTDMATRYLMQYPGTPVRTLSNLFDIHIRTAYRIIDEVENNKPRKLNPWDLIEKDIEGLDWQYNPEKDIQHLTVPNFR